MAANPETDCTRPGYPWGALDGKTLKGSLRPEARPPLPLTASSLPPASPVKRFSSGASARARRRFPQGPNWALFRKVTAHP